MKKLIVLLSAAALMCGCGKTTTTHPSTILAGRIQYDCSTVYANKRVELWGKTGTSMFNTPSTTLLGTTVTDSLGHYSFAYSYYGPYPQVYLTLKGIDPPIWERSQIPTVTPYAVPYGIDSDFYVGTDYKVVLKIASTNPYTSHDTLYTNFSSYADRLLKRYMGPFTDGMILDTIPYFDITGSYFWAVGIVNYGNTYGKNFQIDTRCGAVNVLTLQIN